MILNYIADVDGLLNFLQATPEIILFRFGNGWTKLLDFLKYINFPHNICCIATEQTPGNNTAQDFVDQIPVIPFEMLTHFSDTGTVIVIVPQDYHQQITEQLDSVGFKSVVFVNDALTKIFDQNLNAFAASGQIMFWFMHYVMNKLRKIEEQLAEQNEVCDVHKKTFSEYRNCFRDRKVVIVGNGPTLKHYSAIKDAIHIGVNRAWMKDDLDLDYLFTVDNLPDKDTGIRINEGFDKIKQKIFVGKILSSAGYQWISYPEDYTNNHKCLKYYVQGNYFGQPMHQDICYHPLIEFGTVTSQAMQFALFTYPKELYLVGCDTSHDGHFYSDNPNTGFALTYAKIFYARIKMFARLHYPKTEIISVNPVGLKGLFKDVYTDEKNNSLGG